MSSDQKQYGSHLSLWITIQLLLASVTCQQYRLPYNPTIIQDSRVEPKSDGTFGFLYRTEDGISHVAKGDPTGYIQGSYSYKDPTGLKVNFNYFAGAQNPNAKKQQNPKPTISSRYRNEQINNDNYQQPPPLDSQYSNNNPSSFNTV